MASFGGNREELNIEGGSDGAGGVGGQSVATDSPNNHQVSRQCFLCGKTRKTDDDMDLNQVPTDDVDEEYCTCDETPRVVMQGGQVDGRSRRARSRRARMRQTPRRFEAVVGSDSGSGSGFDSGSSPTYDEAPITIVSGAIPTVASSIEPTNAARPFRIRDIVSRQDTMLRSFGPGDRSHYHALTIGQISRDGLINPGPVPGLSLRMLHEDIYEEAIDVVEFMEEFNELLGYEFDPEEFNAFFQSLLARQEVVNTGLSDNFIIERLRRCYYQNSSPEEAESCAICLVDFVNGDVLGDIDCPHKFHFVCLKEWLMRKNVCPLCKDIAIK